MYKRIYIYVYVYAYTSHIGVKWKPYITYLSLTLFHLSHALLAHVHTCATESLTGCARTNTRARIGAAAAHNGRAASNAGRALSMRCAPPAESGAYLVQIGDGCGIPRAYVRVERRRRTEHLPADTNAVDADGKYTPTDTHLIQIYTYPYEYNS